MANITVSTSLSNIAVNTASDVVTVTSVPTNVIVSNAQVISNVTIRGALSNGYGLLYDTSNGIFSTANTEIRALLSNASPITYDSSTGVIGLEQSLSNITLTQFQETVVNNGTVSGNITADISQGTIHQFTLNGDITGITLSNMQPGGSATLVLLQDSFGGHNLDTTTYSFNWVPWEFVDDYTTLGGVISGYDLLTISYDGTKYFTSVVNFTSVNPASLTVSGNITTTSGYFIGDGGLLSNIGDITAVVAGTGLTGGGSGPGSVQLDVGAGTGITVNADNVAVDMTAFTTSDLAEGTNLYYTQARFDSAFSGKTTSDLTEGTNLYWTTDRGNAATVAYFGDSGNAPFTIAGNLDISGNLNYENVTDLYVTDQKITLNANAASDATVEIIAYRPVAGSNAVLTWNETSDVWEFNDGSSTYTMPRTTTDLTEGTNLYFTNARANAAFVDSLDNISVPIVSTANITTTANVQGSWFIGNVSGTTADFTGNITAGNIVSNSVIDTTADITTTGNITGGWIIAGNDTGGDGIFIGDINGAIQQEVRNESGVTIDRGKAVYLTGDVTGDTPHVALANALVVSKMPAIGIVKNQIANASVGEIVTGGQLNIGTHGFTIGSQLFINGNGDLTETIPTGESNLIQKIGKVVNTQQIIVQGAGRTNATPNLDEGNIFLGSSSGTAIAVAPDSNFDTTGNAFSLSNTLTDVNSISSETGSNITLKGQANGLVVNKTINSLQSEVTQLDTVGYAIQSFDFGSANIATGNVPGLLCSVTATSGTNTATATLSFGSLWGGLQTTGTNYNFSQFTAAIPDFETIWAQAAMTDANKQGWSLYHIPSASITAKLPLGAHVTGISGNTITFSENFIDNIASGSFNSILVPAAHSSTQDISATFVTDTATLNIPFVSVKPLLNKYQFEQTLSNVTLDRVSWYDSTVDMANVVMRRMVDVETGDNGAIRTPRTVLVGKNLTPDVLSVGENGQLPGTTGLGLVAQYDGKSYGSDVDTTPQLKFLLNQFRENSLTSYTTYPAWTQFLGQSGDANVDMSYLGAPTMAFKVLGGNIDGFTTTQTSDVVGRLQFNPVISATTTGSDVFHPPASIVARVPGDPDAPANATLANTDMHFQSTYATSYRNGANTSSGTIPRTFLSSSDGNTIIAAKTDGRIALKPVRDYGDASDSTSFVENRFAHELHDYHTFLSAEFGNTTTKQGTIITIQPNSGETGGSTDFNYDSKGNATLRLNTNEANGVVKTYWDITNEHIGGNLQIARDGTDVVEIGDKFNFQQVAKLHKLSNTEILALTGNEQGDMVYNYTDNLVAYFDGTDWRNIAQGTIIV